MKLTFVQLGDEERARPRGRLLELREGERPEANRPEEPRADSLLAREPDRGARRARDDAEGDDENGRVPRTV